VTLGADGGGLDDLLALAVIGRDKVTREWLAWCHAFADPKVLERRKEIAPALRDFEAEKSLTIGDGAARHARFVALVSRWSPPACCRRRTPSASTRTMPRPCSRRWRRAASA
jgi:hypothetical protein